MFTESAYLYDALYRSIKNYEEESEKIKTFILHSHPNAKTLLDVGCGTGEHAFYLKNRFNVDGIDLNEDFVNIAREKIPSGNFYVNDMSAFDLGKKYDVVVSLFSSIGYVKTLGNLHKSVQCLAAHLKPNGVLLVEPWFQPEQWQAGRCTMMSLDKPDLKVCRMSLSAVNKKISSFTLHYLVWNSGEIRQFSEEHELGLFTKEEMLEAFYLANLSVEYDEVGIFNRGLYRARYPA